MSVYGSRLNGQSYYSPSTFEADKKDLLVSQLKAENFELRQNDRDYQELAQHLKSLEHRYNSLHDEKLRNEVEFKSRGDHNLKTVTILKAEIDNLKSHITDRQLDQQEIRAENIAIKEIADHKTSDVQRLKNELQQVTENNRRLYEDKLKLEVELQASKDEKRRIGHDYEILNQTYEDLVERLSDRNRAFTILQVEQDKLEQEVNDLRSENENSNIDAKSKNENLRYTRLQYQEAQNFISQLQVDLEEIHTQNGKLKKECQIYQEKLQQENQNAFQIDQQMVSLEQANKYQEKQITEYKSELNQLKKNHKDVQQQFSQVSRDEEIYHRNFDILSQQNSELIEEVERFQQQEEQQASLRLNKLKELKGKLHQGIKKSGQDLLYQAQSPPQRSSAKQLRNRFD